MLDDAPKKKNLGGRPPVGDKVVFWEVGLRQSAWSEVDAAAEKAGMTRAAWATDALLSKLAQSANVLPAWFARSGMPPQKAAFAANPATCLHPVRVGSCCLKCGDKVSA